MDALSAGVKRSAREKNKKSRCNTLQVEKEAGGDRLPLGSWMVGREGYGCSGHPKG
jgi:hypothetical protein